MKDYRKDIASYISLETAVLQELRTDQINDVLNILEQALEQEQNIYIFGNGGSAATASHFQNDFNKGVSEHTGKKFRFQCLNDNVATILAIANDIGYEEIFRFQLRGKVKKGDVVIAISGSGRGPSDTGVFFREIFCRAVMQKLCGSLRHEYRRFAVCKCLWAAY